MVTLSDINQFFRGFIAINESMSKYTSMRVGGPADYYVEPADKQDLVEIVKYFQKNNYPFLMLGRGSNIIISDEGIRCAAINLESSLSDVRMEGELVVAEAGAHSSKFVDFCIQQGLAGVETLAGIPGSVGGAVVMNAGAHGGETADHVVEIEVFRDGRIQKVKKQEADFSYRHSGFAKDVVLSASFQLPQGDKEELIRRRREFILKRNTTQPLTLPNSGSMFKNPPGTYAAKLIEQAGLKGKRVGNAQISEKHANFIVNLGDAKAADVVTLVDLVRRTVHQNTGVLLELEVKLVGFSDDVRQKVA
ncbi:MAG: UDP-N-acetylenolpyruvoylglucosamine reductase [Bacteroidetes bacterium]|nr:UDP-N-acetylenolpyruvoylglucosamine reductase [Bacteroidota bacterium]